MRIAWSNKRALLAGCALILATNAVALGGIAYNRSGEPMSELALTERELPIQRFSWPQNDNSTIELRVSWQVRNPPDIGESWRPNVNWLSDERLRALGFDPGPLSVEDTRRYDGAPSKHVFLALEHDGPAHRQTVEDRRSALREATQLAAASPGNREMSVRLTSARQSLDRTERFASRLYVVDADFDADALRARYPDAKQYAIVRGRLRSSVFFENGENRVVVHVAGLDIGSISVPHAYRSVVEPLVSRDVPYADPQRLPRFTATVRYGRRFEPWIAALQPL